MWQVMYYGLNGKQMPDTDNLSDAAMDRYSAPEEGEPVVAVARQVVLPGPIALRPDQMMALMRNIDAISRHPPTLSPDTTGVCVCGIHFVLLTETSEPPTRKPHRVVFSTDDH